MPVRLAQGRGVQGGSRGVPREVHGARGPVFGGVVFQFQVLRAVSAGVAGSNEVGF